MRLALFALIVAVGCGPSSNRDPATSDAGVVPTPDACYGLHCRVVNCAEQGKPPTTISGTVFAPNRTLALYGANVYIPLSDPGPLTDGVQCTSCQAATPGGAVAQVISGPDGTFTLTNVPSGINIPLVIQMGKWRRQITLDNVQECTDNALPAEMTSLPRNKNEGDMPRIAMVTGGCDRLECLVRRLGISDTEFSSDTGNGRIHLYAGNGGTSKLSDNTPLSPASALWGNLDKLKQYDILFHSCECSQYASAKPQEYMNNIKAYADAGGRFFGSHYHSIWIDGEYNNPSHAPAVWSDIATCQSDNTASGTFLIDEVHNPKGPAFAQWMTFVGGSPSPGQIPVSEAKRTCTALDHNRAEQWVYHQATNSPQMFQFTTPNEAEPALRCGKVVFSDMHVSADSSSSSGFPVGCTNNALSPQEKALAFMFFDIATCVGTIE
jgi:hypothetical protein